MPRSRSLSLQRRHFQFIADILADLQTETAMRPDGRSYVDLDLVRARFTSALTATNPRFRRDQFLRASGQLRP